MPRMRAASGACVIEEIFRCQSLRESTIQEGHNLHTIANSVRTEVHGTQTIRDSVFNGPQDRIDIEAILRNISERVAALGIASGAAGAVPVMAPRRDLSASAVVSVTPSTLSVTPQELQM